MKLNRIHLLVAVLATVTANAAEPKTPHPPLPPLLVALDTDRDGELSAAEIAKASAALSELDKNGDGKLTLKEILPPPPKGVTPPPPPPAPGPLFAAIDLNKDGSLSASEIEDAPLALLTLDKNHDGKLSRKELNPPPPPAP